MMRIIRDTRTGELIILSGNFNLDQMLQEKLVLLKEIFNLQQHSRHSTHHLGGILDLVFDSKVSNLFHGLHHPLVTTLSFVFDINKFQRKRQEIKNWNYSRLKNLLIWIWYDKVRSSWQTIKNWWNCKSKQNNNSNCFNNQNGREQYEVDQE